MQIIDVPIVLDSLMAATRAVNVIMRVVFFTIGHGYTPYASLEAFLFDVIERISQ